MIEFYGPKVLDVFNPRKGAIGKIFGNPLGLPDPLGDALFPQKQKDAVKAPEGDSNAEAKAREEASRKARAAAAASGRSTGLAGGNPNSGLRTVLGAG